MRKIAHLSDLHFGQTDPAVPPVLAATLEAERPDVVVVSGDLTQRATDREFAEARAWLDTLPFPRIVVPGNHDVPLYNVLRRFRHPLKRYGKYFGIDSAPFHGDGEIAIVGINTARSFTFKDGRINPQQVEATCRRLHSAGENAVRIIVTHHPFEQAQKHGKDLVGRAAMAMTGFAGCHVDLILSGHLHAGVTHVSETRYDIDGYAALLVQAGTATSLRRRGEPNSFNMILVDWPAISVERWTWNAGTGAFAVSATDRFRKTAGAWRL